MFSVVEPEVPASIGAQTVEDVTVHPPIVHKLHLEFDGWLGDCLIECFPVFAMTEAGVLAVKNGAFTGVAFDDVRITTSEQFLQVKAVDFKLPDFRWAKITGKAGVDDFGIAKDLRLVLSRRALTTLKALGLSHAEVARYSG